MILVKRKYWSSSFVNVRFLLAIQISGNNEMASMSRSTPFPRRLFNMVASESKAGSKVVMWSDDGRAFFVQDEHSFIEEILGRQKQLELSRIPGKTLDDIKKAGEADDIYYGNLKFDPDEFRNLVFPTEEYKKKLNFCIKKNGSKKK